MKKLYRCAITVQQAQQLIKTYGHLGKQLIQKTQDPIIKKLIEKLEIDFQFTIKEKSYFRVEKLPRGHDWHQDTGDLGHMKWCDIGCSVLLTDNFTGGKTWYADNEKHENPTVSDRQLCDLAAHTSDEWHMVEPHLGSRAVLLLFI